MRLTNVILRINVAEYRVVYRVNWFSRIWITRLIATADTIIRDNRWKSAYISAELTCSLA